MTETNTQIARLNESVLVKNVFMFKEKVQVLRVTSNTQLEVIGDVGRGKVQAIGDAINTMFNGVRRGVNN